MDIVLSIFECYQMPFTQLLIRLKSRSYGMSKLYNFQNMFSLHIVFSRPDWTHLMYTFHGTFMNQGTGLITKPNAAKIYSHRSSALERLYQETKFLLLKSNKVEPFNVEYQNQAIKTLPRFSQVSQSKFEANWLRGSWVMIWQTKRDYNFM